MALRFAESATSVSAVCQGYIGSGIAGEALGCSLAYENQEWQAARFDGLDDGEIVEIYLNASERAFTDQQALESA